MAISLASMHCINTSTQKRIGPVATCLSSSSNPQPSDPRSLPRLSAIVSIAAAALILAAPSRAAPQYPCGDVANYYSGTDGLRGGELMRRLGEIVSGHRPSPYAKVWDALKILDAANIDDPVSSSDIIEIYSLRAVPKELAGKVEGWNREHLWPRSYGLVDGPLLTDLHNIRPADVNVNSSRGNKYFGECMLQSTSCIRPANTEAAPDTETDKEIWAPPFKVRGDIARSLMYMVVRYGSSKEPDRNYHLQLSDLPSIKNRKMGMLSTLLKWNALDPPSREEKLRNERICSLFQHNRNPFVDHPEFAALLWNTNAISRQVGTNNLKAWINEFHYENKGMDENEFIEIVVAPSTDACKLHAVLYNGVNGKVYAALPLKDKSLFSTFMDTSGYSIYTAFTSIQNGPADGIALVSIQEKDPEIIQFFSYNGTVHATNGPARGMDSTDIHIQETRSSSKQDSIGLVGSRLDGFAWKKLIGTSTPGKLNVGQGL